MLATRAKASRWIIVVANQRRDEVIILARHELQTIGLRRERAEGHCERGPRSASLLVADGHHARRLLATDATGVILVLAHLLIFSIVAWDIKDLVSEWPIQLLVVLEIYL